MDSAAIEARISSEFGHGIVKASNHEAIDPYLVIEAQTIAAVCEFLKGDPDLAFESLVLLSAVDYKTKLEVVYHLYSMRHRHRIVLKVELADRAKPVVPTVERVWRGANWHEREAYDMMGIAFEGHSDPRRILCPDDWEGYPLRKDYEQPLFYNGMRVRPGDQMVDEARRTAGGVGGFGRGPFE